VLNILRRSLWTGVVTTDYPDAPESAPPAYRGQVELSPARCVGDGACARVCPSDAIVVDHAVAGGWVWELDDARCVFCGLCAESCPTTAITLSIEFELAVRHPADLVTRVTFAPGESQAPTGGNRDE
jgi:formate hydrogenlyase subunit 6/NADH:ubiquinone oxidoreductase subunit I